MAPIEISDEELKKKVVDHMYWSNKVDASDVNVQVDSNEVTLSGSVGSMRMKRDAEDLAYDIEGIYAVENDLGVAPVMKDEPSDEDIRKRAETVLAWDSDIDVSRLEVKVANGVVTLKGTVGEKWKVTYALSKVEELDGVLNVVNELSVVPSESLKDDSIANELMDAFERNSSVHPGPLEVRVEDGDVYLEGSVTDLEEESAVYETAIQTPGVERVIDNLVVKSGPPTGV